MGFKLPSLEEIAGPAIAGAGAFLGGPVGGAVAAGGLGLFGGVLANAQNAQQAKKQMEFQAGMSNTSWQRGVADMKAAGINPMLAFQQGGASTPTGAMAKMDNAIGQGISSALAMRSLVAELENKDAQNTLNTHLGTKALADATLSASNTKTSDVNRAAVEATLSAIKAKAKAEEEKAKYDYKASKYDAIMSRIGREAGTAGKVKNLLNPFDKIDPKKYFYGDKKTGEIFNP